MKRRIFLRGSIVALLSAPLAVRAQQPGRVYRVAYLSAAFPGPLALRGFDACRQALRELGYVEGQNIIIEARWADGKVERLHDLAAELVRRRPDVIVSQGNVAVGALKQATRDIPIVVVAFGDPVASGFIASLARPGANITGFSNDSEEMNTKWLELLKETVPTLSRVAILWTPSNQPHRRLRQGIESATQRLGVTTQFLAVEGRDDIPRAFTALTRARAGALIVLPGAAGGADVRLIVDLTVKNRLPAMYPFPVYAEEGGLMAYGPNTREMGRRAAGYVDKILKGAKPADLPVEQPTKFELVINLKTAKALGLTIPQSILLRADQVLE